MKKKVLQIVNSFHQGGSERQAVQLTRLLEKDGTVEVFLACLNDEGVLRREVEELGFRDFPEYRLTSFFNANFARQVSRCAKFIRRNKIEAVHAHDFYTNIFGMAAATLAGAKFKIASKRETGGMRSKAQKATEKAAFALADAITVNAEAVRNYLASEGVRGDKIRTIYNGLDLERLKPQETNRAKIARDFGLPAADNAKFVVLVANLRHEVKNQPMFIRAARRAALKYPSVCFVLAGEGELAEDLQKMAREIGAAENVKFIGRCEKIPELLSIASVGCLTSFHEGFSNSIIEYMAAGLPVVATNVGGASEAILDGETGYLVASDDDEELAARALEFLEDEAKRRSFGEKGAQRAKAKFSSAAQLEAILNLYGV